MSFDWGGYFTLAEELNKPQDNGEEPPEHKMRSAISRAYYALFNLFKAKLESDKFYFPSKEPHAYLLTTLKGYYGPKGAKIANSIERFRSDRNDADYAPEAEFKQDWVGVKITRMKQTVDQELPRLKADRS